MSQQVDRFSRRAFELTSMGTAGLPYFAVVFGGIGIGWGFLAALLPGSTRLACLTWRAC